MNPTQEKLLNTFLELCDVLIEESFVVTDGFNVDMVSFDKEFAEKRCQRLIRDCEKNNEESLWVVTEIKHAVQYGFKTGHELTKKENENGKVKELRDGKLQQIQKTD